MEQNTPQKTVIRFISSWGGVDSKAKTLKDVLNEFVKDNQDIEVVNDSLFGEDFLPKIKTDFASGNDPDVFGLWPGSDINSLTKAGKVAELTTILNKDPEWKKSFGADMWDYTTYDGKIYGLPVEVIFECLFVNRDLFEKYSVKMPETFEELKNAVAVFNEHGIIPIAFNTAAEGTFLYQNIITMIGGRKDAENPFEEKKVKACYTEAMKYIKELYDMDAFPVNCFSLTNSERNSLFKEKKAAMIVQGSWFIGDFSPDDLSVDILHIPFINGTGSSKATMVYGIGGGSFHMSQVVLKDSLKMDASVKLLKALTSEKTALKFAKDTGMISNVDINKFQINYHRLTIKGKKMLAEANILVGPPDSFVDRSSWEKDIAQQFPYYLEGKIDAQKVWARAISNGIIPG
jgi:ABC-type sugar transport system, periplasmic component